MKLTLLCNAGLALEAEHQMLLIDLPNEKLEPFYTLPDAEWQRMLLRQPPYDSVVGIYITHVHPDHCDLKKLQNYHNRWPDIPIFLPEQYAPTGRIKMGCFRMRYARMDHAPIEAPPCHVVTIVQAGGSSLYLPADAKLDCDAHRAFLGQKQMDAAVWNSMYTSREDTRKLMSDTAPRNLIYHMPADHQDAFGLWKKLQHNLDRYPEELKTVQILDRYPYQIEF